MLGRQQTVDVNRFETSVANASRIHRGPVPDRVLGGAPS